MGVSSDSDVRASHASRWQTLSSQVVTEVLASVRPAPTVAVMAK